MKVREIYLKYKTIIWPSLVGLSSIFILTLVIIPQLVAYFNIRGQISNLQNRTHTLNVKAAQLQSLDEAAIKKDLEVALTVLPLDQDIPLSLTILQDQITKAGLELKTTTFAGGKGGKNSFSFNVGVLGPIRALRDLLISLQDAPLLFQIESLNVRFQKDSSTLEAEIPISVFYQPQPTSLGALDQPVLELTEKESQLLANLTALVRGIRGGGLMATASAIPLGKIDPFE